MPFFYCLSFIKRSTMEEIKIFNKETMSSLQIAEITGKQEVSVINHSNFMGQKVDVYGTAEEPLFLAKDVATWIGHSDVSMMMQQVDDDEKLIQTMLVSGQNRKAWFLTENGLYEVLMQSRKHRGNKVSKKDDTKDETLEEVIPKMLKQC